MTNERFSSSDGPHFAAEPVGTERPEQPVAAWTEVDEGRYMPRRIRGSCLGRALG